MKNFACPVCCTSLSDSLTFGITTDVGGDEFTICVVCDRGMSIAFSGKEVVHNSNPCSQHKLSNPRKGLSWGGDRPVWGDPSKARGGLTSQKIKK